MKRYFAFAILGAATLCSQSGGIQPAGTQIALDTLPMSSAISPDGRYLLVLNAGYKPPSISVLTVSPPREIHRVPVADAWLGLTFAANGRLVYVGGGSRGRVFEFTFSADGELKPSREFEVAGAGTFIGDVTISPDGRLLYAADLFHDSVVAIDPQSGKATARYKTGRRPYRILFHPNGKSFFVSSWADGTVYLHDTASGEQTDRIRLGPHTTDMILSDRKLPDEEDPPRYRLFVAAANTNNVFVVGINEANTMKLVDTINVAIVPRQPLGMTPSAVALNPDQTQLYVTCSDANVVAVADISEGRAVVAGFVPTGPYPTSARALADGRVIVLNGQSSNMSVIDPLTEESIAEYSKVARRLAPPLAEEQKPPPVDHVLYILRSTAPAETPNQNKLAREFVRFDNFRLNSETAADGQSWATAGIATDYTRKMAARRRNPADYEGGERANSPPAGYLWSNALSAGLAVRNYGFFAINREKPGSDGVEIDGVRDPALRPVTNTRYRGVDPAYPDAERVRVFLEDLRQFEASGNMPRLLMMRLGNDDVALGMIVEAVSKSRFWSKTAVFVMEDAAQDPHRSVMLALSPYTRRGTVDANMYDQLSVLRTIELILGLRPMTVFDASARPLTEAFAATPNLGAYSAQK